jgi:DNA-binding NtrC family response regulator
MWNRIMSAEPVILIVGDDPQERDVLLRAMADEPYEVALASSSQEALERSDRAVDVVISELEWGQFNGLELLREWKSRQPNTAFVLLTDGRDVSAAVEAMKLGAEDCVVKPVDPAELRKKIRRVVEARCGDGHDERNRAPRQRPGFRNRIDIPPGTSLDDLERAAVQQALVEHHGNRTHAAKTLGISVRTLQRKLKAWGMPLGVVQQHSPASHFGLPTAAHTQHSSYAPHANF